MRHPISKVRWIAGSLFATAVVATLLTGGVGATLAYADSAAGLPACKHFSSEVPPNRPPGPSHDSRSQVGNSSSGLRVRTQNIMRLMTKLVA